MGSGRIARLRRTGARLCQALAVWLLCSVLIAQPGIAQPADAKSYALLGADRFPFSLPASCAPRLGVAVEIQKGSLVFHTSSLPPNDLATVEAVESCLRDLRPIAQNPRVTYFGSLRAARDKWAENHPGRAPESARASPAASGQRLFAVTRSGTRLAIEGYAIEGDRIRMRLIGGGTLEWAKEEITHIERADGTTIEPPPPPPPTPAPASVASSKPVPSTPPVSMPSQAVEPPRASPAKPRVFAPKASVPPQMGAKGTTAPPEPQAQTVPGQTPTFSARASISLPSARVCCVLQLGSFRVRANADRLARELAAKHPNVEIVSGVSGRSELVYRVRIPVAGDRQVAERLAQQLRTEGYEVIVLARR